MHSHDRRHHQHGPDDSSHTHSHSHGGGDCDHDHGGSATSSAATGAAALDRKLRPIPPPNLYLNGPRDRAALIPLTIVVALTLATLYSCFWANTHFSAPIDPNSAQFVWFEYPGRGMTVGSNGFGGDGNTGAAGDVALALGGSNVIPSVSGLIPGTRSYWPFVGRKAAIGKMRATLWKRSDGDGAQIPTVVVHGKQNVGKTAAVAHYIDTLRATSLSASESSTSLRSRIDRAEEYSAIVWIAASSISDVELSFRDLHMHLRIATMDYSFATILQNIHGWLYAQAARAPWLLVFDDCRLNKATVNSLVPRSGGHVVVVIDSSAPDVPEGFQLRAAEAVTIQPLPVRAAAKLLGSIAGVGAAPSSAAALPRNQSQQALVELVKSLSLQNETALLTTLAVMLKREELNCDEATSSLSMLRAVATTKQRAITDFVLSRLRLREYASQHVIDAFQSALPLLLPDGSRSVRRSLLYHTAYGIANATTPASLSDVQQSVRGMIRYLASVGVAGERQMAFCPRTHSRPSGVQDENDAGVWVTFAGWYIRALRQAHQTRQLRGDSSLLPHMFHAVTALNRHVHSPSASFLDALIITLSLASSAAYSIPTASAVSTSHAVPAHVNPTTQRPHLLFVSAFSAIAENIESSPVWNWPSTDILDVLQRQYGGHPFLSANPLADAQSRATNALSTVPHVMHLLATLNSSLPSANNRSDELSTPLSHTALTAAVQLSWFAGCTHLDLRRDLPAAWSAFDFALRLSMLLHAQCEVATTEGCAVAGWFPRLYDGHIDGATRFKDERLAQVYSLIPLLKSASLPVSQLVAGTLSLIGVACVFKADLTHSAADVEVQLWLEAAELVHMSAYQIRGQESVVKKMETSGTGLHHPFLINAWSQRANVFSLGRRNELAKGVYELNREGDEEVGIVEPQSARAKQIHATALAHITAAADRGITDRIGQGIVSGIQNCVRWWLSWTTSSGATDSDAAAAVKATAIQWTSAMTRPSNYDDPTTFARNGLRTHWELLLAHLRLLRDWSIRAHMESAMYYYSASLNAHALAYEPETALYSTDSLASAARWMMIAHVHSLASQHKEAMQFYTSSLEYHKALLPSQADLRLITAHYYFAKANNAVNRGRTGRTEIENAYSMKVAALGLGSIGSDAAASANADVPVNRALLPELELLCDTCWALGAFECALHASRKVLTLYQRLQGDNDPVTQQARSRVMHIYTAMQQAQEDARKRQAEKLAEQRKLAEDALRRQQQAKAKAATATRKDEL